MLSELQIQNIRNITTLKINPGANFNLIHGNNGSGKTSLLEAIYMLGFGRSFRHASVDKVIKNEQDKLTVFAKLCHEEHVTAVGLERNRNGTKTIKIDQKKVGKFSELAKLTPIQLINPDSFQLLNAGPSYRRQFLDWGVFHVEPLFSEQWRRFQSCLKQRNAALKQKLSIKQIQVWDQEFIQLSESIHHMRLNYIDDLSECFMEVAAQLLKYPFQLNYLNGWKETDLAAALENTIYQDLSVGYTQIGPHKADIKINVDDQLASDILSRGQQKLLVCALKIAQTQLLQQKNHCKSIYLLDDLNSELDQFSVEKILRQLAGLDTQIFVTVIQPENLISYLDKEKITMFHMEHGSLVE